MKNVGYVLLRAAVCVGLAAIVRVEADRAPQLSGSSPTDRADAPLQPGEHPLPLALPVIGGGMFSVEPGPRPLLAQAYSADDAMTAAMWASNESVDDFISTDPGGVHYLFLSYGNATTAGRNVLWMQSRLHSRMQAMGLPRAAVAAWDARLHFATTPADQVGGWLSPMLANWSSPTTLLKLSSSVSSAPAVVNSSFPRLDSQYAWLPWPPESGPWANHSVVDAGSGCGTWPSGVNATKRVAMLQATSPLSCSYSDMVMAAQTAGATAALIVAPQGAPFEEMNCASEAECNSPPSIVATQISYGAGEAVRTALAAGGVTNVSFVDSQTSGLYFAIGADNALTEVGWIKYTWLRQLAWAAQYEVFKQQLAANLSRPAHVVPAFGPRIMHGSHGVVVNVTMPSRAEMRSYSTLELDAALGCPGPQDRDCAIWDHTVQLFVCCNSTGADELCGQEMGRWITPFRRRVGRWLTDISPLLPLLTSPQASDPPVCQFTMKTVPWALPWKPSLNLRFSNPSGTRARDGTPTTLIPLFRGGTFNKSYNDKYQPIEFATPAGAKSVKLVSVITGHGSDNNGCGEFCATSHHFVVKSTKGTKDFSRSFDIAGTPLGCTLQVINGAEPNEHGTWVYGRDGWVRWAAAGLRA